VTRFGDVEAAAEYRQRGQDDRESKLLTGDRQREGAPSVRTPAPISEPRLQAA
jgi:hypothetical protein